MGFPGRIQGFRLIHTPDVHQRLGDAGKLLAKIHARSGSMEEMLRAMTRIQVDQERLWEYLTEVFPDADPVDESAVLRVNKARSWSEYFFDQGRGNRMPGVHGTLWAAFNGVTEWIDHRKTRQTADQRLSSIWFGENYRVKARAFELASEKLQLWKN